MKTLKFTLISLALSLSLALSSCSFIAGLLPWQNRDQTYYGVAEYVDEVGAVCVNIPRAGMCAIPITDECYSEFTSGDKQYDYTVKHGDLIAITFLDVDGEMAIAESYPGRFGRRADSIVAYAENIDIEYFYTGEIASCVMTVDKSEALTAAKTGDAVVFEKDGSEYTTAEISSVTDNRISIALAPEAGLDEFLAMYCSGLELRLVK